MTKTERRRVLFHRAQNGEASLLHPGQTSGEAHSLAVQVGACEDLTKFSLSRRDRAKLRAITLGIDLNATAGRDEGRLSAAEHSDLAARTYAVRQKLVEIARTRTARQRADRGEREELFASATPPFPAPPGFRWLYDVIAGQVHWWFVVPPGVRLHIKKAKKETPNAA